MYACVHTQNYFVFIIMHENNPAHVFTNEVISLGYCVD